MWARAALAASICVVAILMVTHAVGGEFSLAPYCPRLAEEGTGRRLDCLGWGEQPCPAVIAVAKFSEPAPTKPVQITHLTPYVEVHVDAGRLMEGFAIRLSHGEILGFLSLPFGIAFDQFQLALASEIQSDGRDAKSYRGNSENAREKGEPPSIARQRLFSFLVFVGGMVIGAALFGCGAYLVYRRVRAL